MMVEDYTTKVDNFVIKQIHNEWKKFPKGSIQWMKKEKKMREFTKISKKNTNKNNKWLILK